MRTKILMLVVLLSLSAGLIAQTDENDSTKSFRGHNRELRMDDNQRGHANGLNLTDAQKEAMKQSRLATQKQLQPLHNELGELKARQKTLITAEAPDTDAINKNIEKLGALEVEMAKIQAKQHLEMRAQLTDEQRLKFDIHKGGRQKHNGHKGMKQGKGMHGAHSMN